MQVVAKLLIVTYCCAASILCAEDTSRPQIFAANAKLELLHTRSSTINSGLTEGPAVAADGSIYFTDMPFGKTENGMILRYDPSTERITTFTDRAGKSNGLAFDADGFLISCDGADGGGRRLIRWNLSTRTGETLVDRFDGKRYNSPNDLAVDSRGRIYFTDPRYSGDESRELKHRAVYRVDRDGKIREITHDVEKPNGITLSPDCRTLYVGDHNNGSEGASTNSEPPTPGAMKVYAFPLDEQGLVAGPRRTLVDFGKQAGCDGITVDSLGNIYLTCRSLRRPGLMVIDPSGQELTFLPTGPENQSGEFENWRGIPSNVEFGIGKDKHSLYVTIDKSLYRIRTQIAGHRNVFTLQDRSKQSGL